MRAARRQRIRSGNRRPLSWEQLESRLALAFSEFIDPNPNIGNQFGAIVLPLKSGNVVITSPRDDRGGTDAGAVYLFNGSNGNLISTLYGSTADDRIGSDGVYEVGNGNFVVRSLLWDNGLVKDVGAVTWGSGQVGVSGAVSSLNSLIGSTSGDQVGFDGIDVLGNGNYLVRSSSKWDNGTATDAGAITWGYGNVGIKGSITASNSLVGSRAGDQLGSEGVVELTNGNYVVRSPRWDNGTIVDAGAATWGNGTSGTNGQVSVSNSLVGSKASDKLSGNQVIALANGNYVVNFPGWDNGSATDLGAVIWGNGNTGIQGVVSTANSYVGGTTFFKAGGGGVVPLANGNYVFISPDMGAGAVTWGNGLTGSVGVVSPDNSLVGVSFGGNGSIKTLSNGNYLVKTSGTLTWRDGTKPSTGVVNVTNSLLLDDIVPQLGGGGIIELTNGNYVVVSPFAGVNSVSAAGAVTWGSGTRPLTGRVSELNSVVGSQQNDRIGSGGVFPLANGNFVIASPLWNNGGVSNVGAVTLGNGTTGSTGFVSTSNSLFGGTTDDNVGNTGVYPLTNGNYVVASEDWTNGTIQDAGAVTFGNGVTGATGLITVANSLVGDRAFQSVGSGGVTALANGNYVVLSEIFNTAATSLAGAVTWGSGQVGIAGVVNSQNSLVGNSSGRVGLNGVKALANGNYVVINSFTWGGSGAVTWADGSTGLTGFVTGDNSLIGSDSDRIGDAELLTLSNGNYLVSSRNWNRGRGAVTLGIGAVGTTGLATATNSVVGRKTSSGLRPVVLDEVNKSFYVVFLTEDGGKVRVGSQLASSVSISAIDSKLTEGNSGSTAFTFSVTRSGNTNFDSTVTYAVAGSGQRPADLADFGGVLPGGSLLFRAGESTKSVSIAVSGDTTLENDEAFSVTLTSTTNGLQIATGQILATIVDDDTPLNSFLVTNTNDTGAGSLRDALIKANASSDRNRIMFNIPGSGVQTIRPLSQLPQIIQPIDIDASSQPGYSGMPLIELDGTSAGTNSFGLFITGGNSSAKGMVINRFSRDAIGLYLGGDNVVEGNFLGTDSTGSQALGNTFRGVGIYESANNRIGGSSPAARNLISGNLAQGIFIFRATATANHVSGNFIGTDLSGTGALKNLGDGVWIDSGAHHNIIGTDGDGLNDASERNVVSGNGAEGVQIYGVGSDDNVVAGNLIGLSANGNSALSNNKIGVLIGGGAKRNRIGTNSDGKSDALERNVVSGNKLAGLWLSDVGTEETWAAGNFVGTDITGTLAIPNDYGVVINNGATSNRLGTNADGVNDFGERNVISGNRLDGVFIQSAGTEHNQVAGNYIGTNFDGTAALPNGARGISIHPDAKNNLIGGASVQAANVIAYNVSTGITIDGDNTTGNAIRGNAIFSNGRMGIDLNSDGATNNDGGDSDLGPNGLQNYPFIVSAFNYVTGLKVAAQLASQPNSVFEVEFFANDSVDASLHGEGQQFLGRTRVQTDANGFASFTFELSEPIAVDSFVSATATDAQGNTSEFSRNAQVTRAELSLALSLDTVTEQRSSLTGTVTRNTPSNVALTVQLASSDPTAATVPATVTIPAGQTSITFEVAIVNDPIADGDQLTIITASATGLVPSQAQLAVHDDDVAVIRLTLRSDSVSERDGQVVATVTRNTPTTNPLTVTLNSSHPTKAAVPISVVIPDGLTEVDFVVVVFDDAVASGNQLVTMTPNAVGHFSIDTDLTVVDDDIAALSLTLAEIQISESNGVTTGTITRNTPTTSALNVSLASSDPTAATVPAVVTILAGSQSATFTVSAVNDVLADGDQVAIITAAAVGLLPSTQQVTVIDDDVAALTLSLAAISISENGGSTTGTITINQITPADLTIALSSSDPTVATVPATVTIPAGQTSATFTVTAVNDAIADGDHVATITASAVGLLPASQQVTVIDDDIASLTIFLATTAIPENGGSTTGTVTLSAIANADVTIALISSDLTAATVPATVTIPAGQTSATFTVTAVNDSMADGDQVITLTATAVGLLPSTQQVTVIDDDVAALTLSLAATSISENGGSTTGTITINKITSADVTIVLSSSDLTAATVPASVTIPAGLTSATFTVMAVNDAIADGDQVASITATSSGFATHSDQITVVNDDAPALDIVLTTNTVYEEGGTTTAWIWLPAVATSELVINLTISSPAEATVPKTVTIPIGSGAVEFTITAVNDTFVDGDQVLTITAAADGLESATAQITVVDGDTRTLHLILEHESIAENGGTMTGSVWQNMLPTTELIVTLLSSDPTVVTVPASVTFPVGEQTVSFVLTIVDNELFSGDKEIFLRASAPGFETVSIPLLIIEDEPNRLWYNYLNPLDVNFDGLVSPIDALFVINFLNSGLSGALPIPAELRPPPFVDVNADGFLSPLDALLVINELNKPSQAEGENERRSLITSEVFSDFEWLDSLITNNRKAFGVRKAQPSL